MSFMVRNNQRLDGRRRLAPVNRKAERRAVESRFFGKTFCYVAQNLPDGSWGIAVIVANDSARHPIQRTAAWSDREIDMIEDAAELNALLGHNDETIARILASGRQSGPRFHSDWTETAQQLFRAPP